MATTPSSQPTSSLPQPLSYQQIVSNALSAYSASTGINDLNVGSATTSLFQVTSLMVARASGDILQVLRDQSLDRATGPALQNLAIGYGVPPLGALVATGFVTVTDLSFQKIYTTVYAGVQPPIAGSTTVYASAAGNFPATGSVYIGRGTANVEGPLPYSSITTVGSYYAINLSSPTTKYHNIGETIILSQGGVRTVPTNTLVVSPGIGTTPSVQYSVTQLGTILDGETTVTNIPVTALTPGSLANVPAGAISQFSGNPSGLSNASVTNPAAITTGQDTETDDQLRIRVKNVLASTGLGTVTAIQSALQGLQSPTSSDTIVSTDVLNDGANTTVYIDNGSGYEATHQGVGIEAIVNSALGGEKYFQLITGGTQTSVTKALLQTVAEEPFNLSGGEVLSVVVGNITYNHTFQATDFQNPGSATAYEICASINGDTSLNYEAVTAGNGSYVVIRPADEVTNRIQITSPASTSATDANFYLQFPSQLAETLRLYKNGILLTEDGSTASIFTQAQSLWSNTIANGDTLSIAVDGTEPVTYTITDADFVAEGTYVSVNYANSLQSWVNVLNNLLTGVTASIVGSTIELSSNLGAVDRAQISIINTQYHPSVSGTLTKVSGTGDATISFSSYTELADGQFAFITSSANATLGAVYSNNNVSFTVEVTIAGGTLLVTSAPVSYPSTLITKGMFSSTNLSSTGVASDYTLNRNTAQIELTTALKAGDSLSAGTLVTQANLKSSTISSGSVTLAADAHLWIAIDTDAITIPTILSGSLLSVSKPSTNIVRYTSNTASAFSNVFPGDYVIVWCPQLAASNQLEGRVHAVTGSALDIKVTGSEYTAASVATNVSYVSGFVVVRTANVPQKFTVSAGTYTLNVLASTLQAQTDELTFNVLHNTNLTVVTNTDDPNGQVTVVTSDIDGALLGFASGANSVSQSALIAFYDCLSTEAQLPLFFHSQISADSYAEPIASYVTNFNSTASLSGFDPNELISFLNPYGGVDDEQPAEETVQMSAISGTSVTILPQYPDVRRLRQYDRFYVANPLDFGYNDSVVAIVDNNTVGETYTMPLYRRAVTNSTYATNNYSFNAYDVAAGATASFSQNFTGYSFANYKALLQAKRVVSGSNSYTSLLYRSTAWGRTGEAINVSYIYPSSPNQGISSTVVNNDSINIQISLISGNSISTSIANNTQWNVSVTPNTPVAGIDQVTYEYNGTGTAPLLSLSGGEYINITTGTGFDTKNTGTFRVSTAAGYTPTATTFTVQVPTGTAMAQTNVVTTVATGMNFYSASSTTANAINTYVNANLSQYVTATVVNGTGAGVIVLSSYEDSGFVTKNYYLKDGINWVSASNVTGSPQFTFKEPLTYASAPGYAFNGGDEVRLIPTTMDQVKDLWNILAVTGFTTVGTIETVDRGTKLQLATETIGSGGSVQVVGGSGNLYSVPVLISGELIDLSHMIIGANSVASQSVSSDQWFRLQAQTKQNKNTGFASNTSVTVASNTPIAGQSTITLLNQQSNQLYFGAARNFTSVSGSVFRVEKQGSLACLSWAGTGSTPVFTATANLNDGAGWTVNVSSAGVYTVATGATTFSALSIGDIITVSGCVNATNNGSFIIQSVTATSFGVSNAYAVAETGTSIAAGQFNSTLSVSEGDTMIVTSPFSPLNQGTYRVIRANSTSVWFENADVFEEEVLLTSNSQIQFFQYDATVPGDSIVVNGSVLGLGNAGTYKIVSVSSPTVAVVSGSIASQTATNLGNNYNSFSVQEGVAYTGYKQVDYVSAVQGSTTYTNIVFNTTAQYNKINFSAGVALTSLGKLGFPTQIRYGLDSYNYDTGLIGIASRTIVGDPRDTVTFPGVEAAGVSIFIREPLLKRVTISMAIRTNIGVSFPYIVSQIQSTVYSLILSNPLGQSIDLSSIVAAVQAIQGVTSVVITNPAYTVANDEITLVTGEKAFIVNQNTDISVTLIGT